MKLSERFVDDVLRDGLDHMDLVRGPAAAVLCSVEITHSGSGGFTIEVGPTQDGTNITVVVGSDGTAELHTWRSV